jgi:hypothetical protein
MLARDENDVLEETSIQRWYLQRLINSDMTECNVLPEGKN